jgi:hypothetical protein
VIVSTTSNITQIAVNGFVPLGQQERLTIDSCGEILTRRS